MLYNFWPLTLIAFSNAYKYKGVIITSLKIT
jgi:hypothetical protein